MNQTVVALAGNPNVGKSTLFNALTGLRQHTGNWPGKTVDRAQGSFSYREKSFLLVDLPGTYSLMAHSAEEEIARDFICFGRPDVILAVLDGTALERSLNLALQIMEVASSVVVCVNLMDEAAKKGVSIDISALAAELGVPVIPAAARSKHGLEEIKKALYATGVLGHTAKPKQIRYAAEIEELIRRILPRLADLKSEPYFNQRWLALRLLDSPPAFIAKIGHYIHLQNTPTSSLRKADNAHEYSWE
ncbi:MAG: 50S ribosome-binding GTPase [Peptococcaceae bacterium]|jgi:ferrous iron transport protein B|nr:50S ribosome-binding GTPase [Peptococcaceae bacterium]